MKKDENRFTLVSFAPNVLSKLLVTKTFIREEHESSQIHTEHIVSHKEEGSSINSVSEVIGDTQYFQTSTHSQVHGIFILVLIRNSG